MTATAPLPPGPKLPAVLQTLGFIVSPVRFIDALRRRYGDIVTFSTSFDSGFVMVFDPDVVKQVFRAPPDRLRAGEANALAGPVLGQRSVLLLDGAEHLRHRKLMLPPFHGERMRAYEQVMREAADREIDSWPVGEPFPLMPSMQSLTLDVIMRAVFGVEEGERLNELKRRMRAMIDPDLAPARRAHAGLQRPPPARAPRVPAAQAAADELIYDEIAAAARPPTSTSARTCSRSCSRPATRTAGRSPTRELRDELVTLLVAGHETTATGLAWAFDLLLATRACSTGCARRWPRARPTTSTPWSRRPCACARSSRASAAWCAAAPSRSAAGRSPRAWRSTPRSRSSIGAATATRSRSSSAPSASSARTRPTPTRGSRSVAAPAAAWAPAFATFEMATVIRTVLERCDIRPASRRPARMERRGITIVPRDGGRIVVMQRRPAAEPVAAATPAGVP